jgi:hypothetical protein
MPHGRLLRPSQPRALIDLCKPLAAQMGKLSASLKAPQLIVRASPAVNLPSRAHSVGPWGIFSGYRHKP